MGLVELMIALTMGLFLLAGLITIFIHSKQSYRHAEAVARLQENARYAFHVLSRGIRMAGYQGCGGGSASLNNTLNVSSPLWDFSRHPLEGFEATGVNAWSTVRSGNPATTVGVADIDPAIRTGTDVVTIRSADSVGIGITAHPACPNPPPGNASLEVVANTVFQDGMVVMATNCTSAAIFQIAQFNDNHTVVHNTGAAVPGNATNQLGACYVGGELIAVSAKSYYLRNNAAGEPALYRKTGANAAEELVEGVENMQISYGVDTDHNDRVNTYCTAAAIENGTCDASDAASDWGKVISARIALLVRGPENNVTTAAQTLSYNGATYTAPDRRLRQVFTTTIALRNRAY